MRKVGQEKWGDKSGAKRKVGREKVRREKSGAKRKVGKREK